VCRPVHSGVFYQLRFIAALPVLRGVNLKAYGRTLYHLAVIAIVTAITLFRRHMSINFYVIQFRQSLFFRIDYLILTADQTIRDLTE